MEKTKFEIWKEEVEEFSEAKLLEYAFAITIKTHSPKNPAPYTQNANPSVCG